VKLLFDENLSPRLVALVEDLFPESAHVHRCGLGRSDDAAIWEYAKSNGFTVVSKDSDFQERSVVFGSPPKVIWLRTANCSSDAISRLLRNELPAILGFLNNDSETCLILTSTPKSE
jgi:predicted nuclease of predicted toxin-antitoxin system